MNHFSGQGIILSVRPHGENGAVVHVLSDEHGKCGGYVNGAQASNRLKSTLQQGNIVSFDWSSKTDGQLGRFEVELDTDIAGMIFHDAKALLAAQSACGLIDMFLPERENHVGLFHGTQAVLQLLKTDQWPPAYILWEIAFLKEMGYGIDLSQCAVCGTTEGLTHISPKTGRAVCGEDGKPYADKLLPIPSFMRGAGLEPGDIALGLCLNDYFLTNRLLQYSSYQSLPDARVRLQNAMDSV
jgi:DNA repair protein RecO (recombination protein O)